MTNWRSVRLCLTTAFLLTTLLGCVSEKTPAENLPTPTLEPTLSEPEGYFVSPSGDNSNPGTFSQPWETVENALSRMEPGETLLLRAGTYHLDLTLDERNSGLPGEPVTLKAYQGEDVVLLDSTIRFYGASWWVLDGLRFDPLTRWGIEIGQGGPATDDANSINSHHLTIQNSEFLNGDHEGIAVINGDDILVDNCTFNNLRSGVPGKDLNGFNAYYLGHRITVQNSRFEDIGSDGIHIGTFYYKPGADITGIKILNNEFWIDRPYEGPFGNVGENGVDIKSTPGPVLISGNTFHGFRATVEGQDQSGSNGEAIVVHRASEGSPGASGVTIEKNLFYDNTRHVVIAHNTSDITIRNNIFRDAAEDPNVRVDGVGVQMYNNVEGIEIVHNTFTNNKFHIYSFTDTGISGVIMDNLFMDGGFYAPPDPAFRVESDYNAFSLTDPIPTTLIGEHDLLVEDTQLDSRLAPTGNSPLIDAGENVGVVEDFEGTPRPQGEGFDIGAFEFINALEP